MFERPGPSNTEKTISIAIHEAKERNIKYLVVASTRGDTGVLCARRIQGTNLKLVVVGHNTGFKTPGIQEFEPEKKREIESLGGTILLGTMVLRSLGTAIRGLSEGSEQDLVAHTLRILGQGVKVCAEITSMAADAGLIPIEDIIAIAGTGRGADTAAIIFPQPSNMFFNMKIREFLAKPYGI
jgi:hypothetical protein